MKHYVITHVDEHREDKRIILVTEDADFAATHIDDILTGRKPIRIFHGRNGSREIFFDNGSDWFFIEIWENNKLESGYRVHNNDKVEIMEVD